MKSKFVLFAITLAAFRLSAADGEKPLRPAAGAANRPQAVQGGPGIGAGAFERVLTDEQRGKMREYLQEQGAGARQDMQKAAQLRRELQEAVFSGKADDKFIKEKADEIAKLEAEQLRLRMTALSKVAATLTPEQREKIKEMGEQMRSARPGLGGGREGEPPPRREPAAPPPPEK